MGPLVLMALPNGAFPNLEDQVCTPNAASPKDPGDVHSLQPQTKRGMESLSWNEFCRGVSSPGHVPSAAPMSRD